ncbi:MAG TPA: transaldolase family protein [Thermoleophilaceae bacterium]|jgi:transaldolase
MAQTPLQLLAEYGQSPWLSAPPRRIGLDGELQELVRDHGIKGVTSAGANGDEAGTDVRQACDLMRPLWEASGMRDGYVTLQVDPTLAHDAPRMLAYAKRLRALIARPNLMVGIPATRAGLEAIESAIAARVPVEVTRIYSLARYRQVVDAYARGVERLIGSGGDPAQVASVAAVQLCPVDAEVDRRLDAIGGDATRLKGRLAIANARLIYAEYKQAVASPRCLWVAAPVRGCSDVLYVEELIGSETVVAVTPETIAAVEDHALVADTLERAAAEAPRTFREIEAAGVDLDDVWRVLEARAEQATSPVRA